MRKLEAEYDKLAEEYDATRDSASEQEIQAIAHSLEDSKTILDVGVGTGRFAKPISALGFEVIGVDVSRRMLQKAREKGVDRVLLADGYSLPFRDKVFDGAIIIHVLHVVVDWSRVMHEIGRVTSGNVATIINASELENQPAESLVKGPSASKPEPGGYPVRTQHRLWRNEKELLARVPPTRLERVRDEVVSIPVAEALRRVEAKRSMGVQIMPPEARRAITERLLAMTAGQVVHRRIARDLAVWKADQLTALDG